ncbi:hypothetical protein QKU48_gp0595 [Fadolivirus algeromassiliense]|jgi:hypothetical protein|uniref:Uncharacterized protein n=1 Tax=Fadolivirus FV1/VV64 TaxID=3070911 RepID=A0A7D3UQT0_9VIRU|nr:hypothetical protein QKU48_gp0595 [Fadolivirus algeromassiliense]QKF94053.1 hypothetical protein Fadolivirus_1_595 [Fadolivirus FV1/VV64]
MLNTSAIKKNNNNLEQSSLQKMANETIIEKGIREINEATDTHNDFQDDTIAKSFHAMEGKIFNNLGTKTELVGGNNDEIKSKFDFSEITNKYSDNKVINSVFDNDRKLMVSINEELKKISVFDEQNKLIGYFTIEHLIKYLSNIYDIKNQFIKDIDNLLYEKGRELIKTLIFRLQYNKKNKYVDFIFNDYTKSGFMGDIELLIKFNNLLYTYQTNKLQTELSKVDVHNRIKIETTIKKFIFLMLNYTLKLISIMSETLKDKDNHELKDKMLNYSISIVYRINIFVQEQLKVIHNQNKNLKELIDNSATVKETINRKITDLVDNIKLQNELLTNNNHQIRHKITHKSSSPMGSDERIASSYYDYSNASNKSAMF